MLLARDEPVRHRVGAVDEPRRLDQRPQLALGDIGLSRVRLAHEVVDEDHAQAPGSALRVDQRQDRGDHRAFWRTGAPAEIEAVARITHKHNLWPVSDEAYLREITGEPGGGDIGGDDALEGFDDADALDAPDTPDAADAAGDGEER